ncbi:MAG: hypothetical protein E6Q88_10945 [Lysobacteraceae bacterium]|nr:MAG: hypothetical protein E6Q88_10945 [Xanthomonadaceae bacterium]
MSWLGIIVVALGAYFAFKVVKFVFKLLWWGVVLVGAYWFFAPMLGLPALDTLVFDALGISANKS